MSNIKKFKNITDYIYGLISIPNHFFKFIDSIYIQRLRNIRQIPTAQYVFPSVNHSCFEHSLGTYFLSNKYITDLKSRQNELEINQTLINTISLCGLFNNLGTLPFLNSFKAFYKEKYNIDYNEKEKAYDLILKLIESKGIDPELNGNDNENFDLNIIKKIFTTNNNNKKYYEQIVFNEKTGIDCDSFDNLNRDIYKYGTKPLYDHNIIMNSTQIINDQICYRYEDAFSVYDYYNAKYTISTKFYFHRISTAIELMFIDILKNIDNIYNFQEIINNNDKFIYFFDSFIYNIKNSKQENKEIVEAKKLLNDIDKRNLYTFVGEYYLSNKQSENEFENFNENTLIENRNKKDEKLNTNEIRIKKDIIYLGQGDFDPLNNIYFYDNECKIMKRKNEDVSKLLAKRYKSRIIRVFLVNKDKKKIEAAQNALENYKKKYKGFTNLYKSEAKINNDEKEDNNYKYNFNINLDEDEDEDKKENIFNRMDKSDLNRIINRNKEKGKIKGYSQYFNELKKK